MDPWVTRLVQAADAFRLQELPPGECLQKLWVLHALQKSTRGYAKMGLAAATVSDIMGIIKSMQGRNVEAHLRAFYQLLDHRGSDFRLETGDILESYRQAVPYLAPGWLWHTVQAYRWDSSQHINVLELSAAF